ncbi:Hypothetical predicted protein [Paramuricea clavata]|uniref:Uncharacterized protein n=1 Tax=Paramuricea clavata TaxID=317549 RepID=A0A6S7G4H5_PARCT|nr:Hypothetical predicted protein [Paramuricea clavata]
MEKFQVGLPAMESSNETCSLKRVFLVILIFVIVGLIGWNSYLTPKTIELEHEINSLKKENEHYKVHPRSDVSVKIIKKIYDHETSLRRLDNRTAAIQNEIRRLDTRNKSVPNTEHDLRQSFKDIKEHLDVLVKTVGNLSAVVLRMNSSSSSTISRLRSSLNETKNDLIRLQNDMAHLNKSIHTDITPFLISAVKDVSDELNTLRKLTTANVSELWRHWNRTDAEIEDIIKLIAQQNETLHFKIAYHSDRLYSEVKDVEKKQSRLRDYTVKNVKDIRNEMNQTRQGLQQSFDNEIARANRSWHNALEEIDVSLRLSMAKINLKADGIKQELQKSIDNIMKKQKATNDDFLKTKQAFQEKDRKHDSDISGEASEMKKVKTRIETLEGKLDSKTRTISDLQWDLQNLQNSVNKMKNKANRVLGSYAPLILVLLYILTC